MLLTRGISVLEHLLGNRQYVWGESIWLWVRIGQYSGLSPESRQLLEESIGSVLDE